MDGGVYGPLRMRVATWLSGRPVPGQPSRACMGRCVAGVVVAVAGVQVTAKAVGDVLRWPVAELVAAQGRPGSEHLRQPFQQELVGVAGCG